MGLQFKEDRNAQGLSIHGLQDGTYIGSHGMGGRTLVKIDTYCYRLNDQLEWVKVLVCDLEHMKFRPIQILNVEITYS